jgi:sialate O-acetylesterase
MAQWLQKYPEVMLQKGTPPPQPEMPLGIWRHEYTVSGLYNAMVAPLIPYAIKGVLWYQGESNVGQVEEYRTLLPAMIKNWRGDWGQGDFPFIIVQLANYMQKAPQPVNDGWAQLREVQLKTASSVPHAGLVVTIDLGDANDIHPRNKQDVGYRCALAAEAIAYHRDLVYSGPIYKSMTREGRKVKLEFTHIGGGLVVKNNEILKGFSISDNGRDFVWAQAQIDGNAVLVWAEGMDQPAAVRYSWEINPDGNLYNREGLPASPFTTEN